MATKLDEQRLAQVAALRLSFMRFARRIRRHGGAGLTPSQLSVLSTLERHGAMPLGRLAEKEQISKSTMTRMAANLEALGLVERRQDSADGRVFELELTESGRTLLAESSRRADEYLDRQIAALDPEDREILFACIPVLQRLLEVKA